MPFPPRLRLLRIPVVLDTGNWFSRATACEERRLLSIQIADKARGTAAGGTDEIGGHCLQVGRTNFGTSSLIIPEKEQSVFYDRSTNGPTEYSVQAGRNESPTDRVCNPLREWITCLGGVAAPKTETAAVQRIAAGLGLTGHNAGYGLAKLSFIVLAG